MDFDTFFNKLYENVDTTNYVQKYQTFGQKLKDQYNISSHEDSFVDFKMASYFNNGILYKYYFRTINKPQTLKKILKLVNNRVFEVKSTVLDNVPVTAVEVVYSFKDIQKIIDKSANPVSVGI